MSRSRTRSMPADRARLPANVAVDVSQPAIARHRGPGDLLLSRRPWEPIARHGFAGCAVSRSGRCRRSSGRRRRARRRDKRRASACRAAGRRATSLDGSSASLERIVPFGGVVGAAPDPGERQHLGDLVVGRDRRARRAARPRRSRRSRPRARRSDRPIVDGIVVVVGVDRRNLRLDLASAHDDPADRVERRREVHGDSSVG